MKTSKKNLNLSFLRQQIIILLVMILPAMSIISCSDDDNPANPQGNTITLSGTVNNLTNSGRLVNAVMTTGTTQHIVGTDSIGSDNNLSITLNTPEASFLGTLTNLFPALGINNLVISDPNTKGNYVTLYTYASGGTPFSGIIVKANSETYFQQVVGNFYVNEYYSDRNATVTGSAMRIDGSDTTKFVVNLDLSQGYNLMTSRITVVRNNYLEAEIFTGEPNGASWYFVPNVSGRQSY